MGRSHRHGKPARRPPRGVIVGTGAVVAATVVAVVQPWSGIAAGSHQEVNAAQFRAAATRECVADYRRASSAARRSGANSSALVALSIATLQQIARDVSAEAHPASMDADLARVRTASGALVSYMKDNRDSIASRHWSPATEAAAAPLTDARNAYLALGLPGCVSPAGSGGAARKHG
jgi:hypothetical protein